jgi:hypothetical protein
MRRGEDNVFMEVSYPHSYPRQAWHQDGMLEKKQFAVFNMTPHTVS